MTFIFKSELKEIKLTYLNQFFPSLKLNLLVEV